ncbi:MAG: hypothetical protein U5J82_03770 [Desulfobacterales bacterium]|nr:hypothetical protein [Desulfobacterales bacterium]
MRDAPAEWPAGCCLDAPLLVDEEAAGFEDRGGRQQHLGPGGGGAGQIVQHHQQLQARQGALQARPVGERRATRVGLPPPPGALIRPASMAAQRLSR